LAQAVSRWTKSWTKGVVLPRSTAIGWPKLFRIGQKVGLRERRSLDPLLLYGVASVRLVFDVPGFVGVASVAQRLSLQQLIMKAKSSDMNTAASLPPTIPLCFCAASILHTREPIS